MMFTIDGATHIRKRRRRRRSDGRTRRRAGLGVQGGKEPLQHGLSEQGGEVRGHVAHLNERCEGGEEI